MVRRAYRTDSQPSNLDRAGVPVKRGALVEFSGGAVARVSWVRLGRFATDVTHHTSGTPCSRVKVITER